MEEVADRKIEEWTFQAVGLLLGTKEKAMVVGGCWLGVDASREELAREEVVFGMVGRVEVWNPTKMKIGKLILNFTLKLESCA